MAQQSVSRRKFIKIGAITIAATGVVCCGGGYLATRRKSPAVVVETPSFSFGDPAAAVQSVFW